MYLGLWSLLHGNVRQQRCMSVSRTQSCTAAARKVVHDVVPLSPPPWPISFSARLPSRYPSSCCHRPPFFSTEQKHRPPAQPNHLLPPLLPEASLLSPSPGGCQSDLPPDKPSLT